MYAQGALPAAIQNVLDFALALEIFENEFYKAVLGTSASAAVDTAFAPVRALLPPYRARSPHCSKFRNTKRWTIC